MIYRELGNTGEKVSILGFGAMRFPTIGGKPDQIEEVESNKMLEYAIENGVNYIDTGFPYHSATTTEPGQSEPFIGEFLNRGYREKVLLATKLPSWIIEKKEDMEYYLDLQLKQLGVDQIDFYLIHTIIQDYWNLFKELDLAEFLDNIKSDGRVKYVGFSFHDEFDLLLEVMDHYEWDVAQTQMNYLDENYQSGLEGLKYIGSQNVGNIVMEPLRGGNIVENIPADIMNIWDKSPIKRTPLEWAFQYLYDMEYVDVVLSGMSSLEQVKENIAIANTGYPNTLSDEEKGIIKEVALAYKKKKANGCTQCGYCMPCPEKVDIPNCFKEYNIAMMLDNPEASAMQYFSLIKEESLASNCINCGKCTPHCTQMINIPEELEKVKNLFES
ncbi:aldo/keto reductase [Methanobrevibacter filiformis]|uniref:Putative aldo-keto reductase n=1 Tax=Methanobrevibacter filiformis TaxID=55758 RepID=A0A165Z7C9_9EURY|nr:aldo/keto reductase [Methanobrevibacter filiformis]KZX10344.1 putative aldo-keto reductase [Methanobrevibacter filiformis]